MVQMQLLARRECCPAPAFRPLSRKAASMHSGCSVPSLRPSRHSTSRATVEGLPRESRALHRPPTSFLRRRASPSSSLECAHQERALDAAFTSRSDVPVLTQGQAVSPGAALAFALLAPAALHPGLALALQTETAQQTILNPAIPEVSAVLEAGVLLLYLGGLIVLLGFGTFLVVRQVLVRTELENAAKELQERVRTGQASSEEYFELGAVMLRKKFYSLANRYLLQAVAKWEGDEQELAQVHNALGFSYFSEDQWDKAVAEYEKALRLQPAYVTAWNNLGDAYERKKDYKKALNAYDSSLMYDPSNRVAKERREYLQRKVEQVTY